MKLSYTITLLSTVALATAQYTYNAKDDSFKCSNSGLAAYCVGGSIIMRCQAGVGHPGNCNDNLAGEKPYGNDGNSGCYQSSPTAGDAACTKAGLVYPSSGTGKDESAPYPIPVGGSKATKATAVADSARPKGTASPNSNSTDASAASGTSGHNGADAHRWTNGTNAYVAGSGNNTNSYGSSATSANSNGGSSGSSVSSGSSSTLTSLVATSTPTPTKAVETFTGTAAQKATAPYWAFAGLAILSLL